MNIQDLIKKLSAESTTANPLPKPSFWLWHLIIFTVVYYLFSQFLLGVRADFSQKILEPFFAAEILLMLLLLMSLLASATLMIYPDSYQKAHFFKAPKMILILFIGVLATEFFRQNHNELLLKNTQNIECSICIAALSIAPAFYFFYILRNGVSSNNKKAGFYATCAAATIGCIALRISEQQDMISHVIIWHYFPIIFFSAIGSFIGKMVLKNL